jgi:hypothetical protein
VSAYLAYVWREARVRFDAGMDAFSAARDIDLRDFAEWSDAERLAVNVDTLYRDFGKPTGANVVELFERMAELRAARRR